MQAGLSSDGALGPASGEAKDSGETSRAGRSPDRPVRTGEAKRWVELSGRAVREPVRPGQRCLPCPHAPKPNTTDSGMQRPPHVLGRHQSTPFWSSSSEKEVFSDIVSSIWCFQDQFCYRHRFSFFLIISYSPLQGPPKCVPGFMEAGGTTC